MYVNFVLIMLMMCLLSLFLFIGRLQQRGKVYMCLGLESLCSFLVYYLLTNYTCKVSKSESEVRNKCVQGHYIESAQQT